MIYDLVGNANDYSIRFGPLSKAVAFIDKLGRSAKDGRYDICGDEMYAIVSSYRTKDDRALAFEAHRKYIDVQCMLGGEEQIDVTQGSGFRVKDRYSVKKDVFFIYPPKQYSSIILTPGHFTLFYPHDFHRPGQARLPERTSRAVGQAMSHPQNVRKLVIKISVDMKRTNASKAA